jgi:hypothetical protein
MDMGGSAHTVRKRAGSRGRSAMLHGALIELLEDRRLLALVTWDGGGGDTDWRNALNWSGDALPGATDDVVIDVPGDVTITHHGAAAIIRSIQSQESLTFTASHFEVQAPSEVHGALLVNGGLLIANGTSALLRASGPTSIIDANLHAFEGVLELPNLAEYHTGGNFHYMIAEGAAAAIRLHGLHTLTGSVHHGNRLDLIATRGGTLDFRNTATLGSLGTVTVLRVEGPDSHVDLSGTTQIHSVNVAAVGGALIEAPALATYRAGHFTGQSVAADGAGSRIDFSHATFIEGHGFFANTAEFLAVNGGFIDLSGATTLGVVGTNTTLRVMGPTSHIDVSNVLQLNTVSLQAEAGGILSLPRAVGIATGDGVSSSVTGAGSRIDLPVMADIAGALRPSNRHGFRAFDGGVFNLGTEVPVVRVSDIIAIQTQSGTVNTSTLHLTRAGAVFGHAVLIFNRDTVIHGDLVNDGFIAAEVFTWPASLAIVGNYTQGHLGAINLVAGGRPETLNHDRFHVAGHADICGSFNSGFVADFPLVTGDVYEYITFESFEGEFERTVFPPFGGGLTYSMTFTETSMLAHAVPDVRPVIPSLSASSPTVPQGGQVTLTADGVADPNGSVAAVLFHLDGNGDGRFDPCFDPLVARDDDGSDGWNGAGLVGALPLGHRMFFARAIDDHHLYSAAASVLVSIEEPSNTAPVAVDDAFATDEGTVLAGSVLGNDQDPEGDALTASVVGLPAHGQVLFAGDGSFTYTPDPDFVGSDSFTYRLSDGQLQSNVATVTIQVVNRPDLSGAVFDDLDNDGFLDAGEQGIAGVVMRLTGTDGAGPVDRTTVSGPDGLYEFDDLRAGTYSVSQVAQPAGLLDGRETAGGFGGVADNSADSNEISGIVVGAGAADAGGYLFAEIRPSAVLGLVWEDFNDDGQVNFGEKAIAGVTVELTGTDDRGNAVSVSTLSDSDGIYSVGLLRPGIYSVRQVQPDGFVDGRDALGTVNGDPSGDASMNDLFSAVVLPGPDSVAEDYNFGERPVASGGVSAGQTATIGFWQNNNGQALIRALNGGPTATQLGDWLAATFPNMYGASAGASNLAGQTNAQVAEFYRTLFRRNGGTNQALGLAGPAKMDAQIMAVALAVYVTNETLAGAAAEPFGFVVTATGVGTRTFDVGGSGAAFGVADGSNVAVLDLLLATDARSIDGVLYDLDGDGDADDDLEGVLRTMANEVFDAINSAGSH